MDSCDEIMELGTITFCLVQRYDLLLTKPKNPRNKVQLALYFGDFLEEMVFDIWRKRLKVWFPSKLRAFCWKESRIILLQ